MNLSFAISVQGTKFESVGKGNWKNNIALMSRLGFDGVEIAVRDPKSVSVKELQLVLKRHQMKLVAIGTGQAYIDERLSLTADDEPVRFKAVSRLREHIDLANIFSSQVIIGLIRGNLGGSEPKRKKRFKYLEDSIVELADYGRRKNVLITIEPLNRYESDCLNRAEEVINLIKETGCTNLRILLDTFHMNIEEKHICKAIEMSNNFLSHVHFADSNRKYPGEGHLDFFNIVETLRRLNYDGFISGEMFPYPDLETAMRNYIKFMEDIVNEQF